MARLTSKARNAMPAKTFAGPNRSFPIPDKGHARAALQDVPKALKHGSITLDQAVRIRARAHKKLGK
ncbi:MAG TPA: hypothetical protein VJ846_01445 [Sphingomicrobium sp.]|nr:hypothetical protein [Sphingomicrobium sp.]